MSHRIKRIKTSGFAVASAGLLALATDGSAAVLISVDMDPATVGIQSTRLAGAGDLFTADLIMTVGAEGVSSYGVSANFDTAELALDGSPAASYPVLPGGLAAGPAPLEDNSLGRAWYFNAFTGGTGPSLTTFVFGKIKFKVTVPVTDVSEDVTPGFFYFPGGFDSMFDNAGGSITPTFVGGTVNVVPEPGAFVCLMSGVGFLLVRRRRS